MEKEERIIKKIKLVYTTIMQRLVDKSFKFPNGGKADGKVLEFLHNMSAHFGEGTSSSRIVDYCVFQIHKNRNSNYQNKLAINCFCKTAMNKYLEMSGKNKTYMEDQWLKDGGLDRVQLYKMLDTKQEHPHSKYIYMSSEEITKKRFLNQEMGFVLCLNSTLLWSPFSPTCNQCVFVEKCKKTTENLYPELFRLRLEKYEKEH